MISRAAARRGRKAKVVSNGILALLEWVGLLAQRRPERIFLGKKRR